MTAGELLLLAAQGGAGVEGVQQSQPEGRAAGNEFTSVYMGKEGSRGCLSL